VTTFLINSGSFSYPSSSGSNSASIILKQLCNSLRQSSDNCYILELSYYSGLSISELDKSYFPKERHLGVKMFISEAFLILGLSNAVMTGENVYTDYGDSKSAEVISLRTMYAK
jgi:hypothetical protein